MFFAVVGTIGGFLVGVSTMTIAIGLYVLFEDWRVVDVIVAVFKAARGTHHLEMVKSNPPTLHLPWTPATAPTMWDSDVYGSIEDVPDPIVLTRPGRRPPARPEVRGHPRSAAYAQH